MSPTVDTEPDVTPGTILKTPSFHELPLEDRRQILNAADPTFAALPLEEQNSVFTRAYKEFGVLRPKPVVEAELNALQARKLWPQAQPQAPAQPPSLAGFAPPSKYPTGAASPFGGSPQVQAPAPLAQQMAAAGRFPGTAAPPPTTPIQPLANPGDYAAATLQPDEPEPPALPASNFYRTAPREPLVHDPTPFNTSPQIQTEEKPPAAPPIMLNSGTQFTNRAVPEFAQVPDKDDPMQAAHELRALLWSPADGVQLKADTPTEKVVNGLLRMASGLTTPENVLLMATGAGIAEALPELINTPRIAAALVEHPAAAQLLDAASKKAVSAGFAGYGAVTGTPALIQGIKEGNLEKIVQGAGGLTLAGLAGADVASGVKETQGLFPRGATEEVAPADLGRNRPGRATYDPGDIGTITKPRYTAEEIAAGEQKAQAEGNHLAVEQWRNLSPEERTAEGMVWVKGHVSSDGLYLREPGPVYIREMPGVSAAGRRSTGYQVVTPGGKVLVGGESISDWLRNNIDDSKYLVHEASRNPSQPLGVLDIPHTGQPFDVHGSEALPSERWSQVSDLRPKQTQEQQYQQTSADLLADRVFAEIKANAEATRAKTLGAKATYWGEHPAVAEAADAAEASAIQAHRELLDARALEQQHAEKPPFWMAGAHVSAGAPIGHPAGRAVAVVNAPQTEPQAPVVQPAAHVGTTSEETPEVTGLLVQLRAAVARLGQPQDDIRTYGDIHREIGEIQQKIDRAEAANARPTMGTHNLAGPAGFQAPIVRTPTGQMPGIVPDEYQKGGSQEEPGEETAAERNISPKPAGPQAGAPSVAGPAGFPSSSRGPGAQMPPMDLEEQGRSDALHQEFRDTVNTLGEAVKDHVAQQTPESENDLRESLAGAREHFRLAQAAGLDRAHALAFHRVEAVAEQALAAKPVKTPTGTKPQAPPATVPPPVQPPPTAVPPQVRPSSAPPPLTKEEIDARRHDIRKQDLDQKAADAKQRILDRLKNRGNPAARPGPGTSALLGEKLPLTPEDVPDMMDDLAAMGAQVREELGHTQLGPWRREMREIFGPAIEPHLLDLYDRSAAIWDESNRMAHQKASIVQEPSHAGTHDQPAGPPAATGETAGGELPGRAPAGRDELVRPDGAETLGGVSSDHVPGPGAQGQTDTGGDRGAEPHAGGTVRTGSGAEGATKPGVGDGEGELHTPPGRGGRSETGEQPGNLGVPGDRRLDYRITDADQLGAGGLKAKAKANLDAIRLLKQLELEGRAPTPEEQRTLVRFAGWGSLAQSMFENDRRREWEGVREDLRGLLTEEEYAAARRSTTNAHYTTPTVIRAMWDAIRRFGVQRGASYLEPGMGVGHFFGLQPEDLLDGAKRAGVELDSITARIARQLYPNAQITRGGFQEVRLPNNFFDVAISNVPFENVPVVDNSYPRPLTRSLHNYFFVKAIDKVRPGGVLAFVTSSYTMDSQGDSVRRYLASQANFLGAIRLPNTAFKENAGTEVTTDIIFLQKRPPQTEATGETWAGLGRVAGENNVPYTVNEYYARHPEMMLGTMGEGKVNWRGEPTLNGEITPEKLAAAVARLPENVVTAWERPEAFNEQAVVQHDQVLKDGNYVWREGIIQQAERVDPRDPSKGYRFNTVPLSASAAERVRAILPIRDARNLVIRTQMQGADEATVLAAREQLNTLYDAFVAKYGPLNSRANYLAFGVDPDAPPVMALEDYDKGAAKALPQEVKKQRKYKVRADGTVVALGKNGAEYPVGKKRDVFRERVAAWSAPVEKVDSAAEAMAVSFNELGRIDWSRMYKLTGRAPSDLQAELGNLIFQNPEGLKWESADEYLSGAVRAKLKAAEAASAVDPRYARNVKALEAVLPEDLLPGDIHAALGAPWVPPTDIRDFIAEITDNQPRDIKVAHVPAIAQWEIKASYIARGTVANNEEWGAPYYTAMDLINDALNSRFPTVYMPDPADADKRIVDTPKTEAAREKQNAIKARFEKWLWEDAKRADRLVRYYNDNYNDLRLREFNGEHLTLPGSSPTVMLRPHQKNAAWRVIQSGNTLLAHAVGAGKTWTMAAAAMEMRRMGLAKKPMFVVPNHLVGQWRDEFLRMYPAANLFVADKSTFERDKRKAAMSRIATGNYDAVIVSHRSFEFVPISDATFNEYVQRQIDELVDAIEEMQAEAKKASGKTSKDRTVKELEKAKARLDAKIKERADREHKDDALTFEEMGIDWMFVDEAHAYKNLFFVTKMQNISGLSKSESNRAFDMFYKTQYLTERGNGRGTVFATGTPVSNTMAEVYTMQRFLQMKHLKDKGIAHFDAWAASYTMATTNLELAAEGTGYRQTTSFSKFINLPELLTGFRQVMDIQTADMLNLPRPGLKTGAPIIVVSPSSPGQIAYMKDLVRRAEDVRAKRVKPQEDNMLWITSDGRKAALDLRLVRPDAEDWEQSKTAMVTAKAHQIWRESQEDKGAQLIFVDLSTPKARNTKDFKFAPGDRVEMKDAQHRDAGKGGTVQGYKMTIATIGGKAKPMVAVQFDGEPEGTEHRIEEKDLKKSKIPEPVAEEEEGPDEAAEKEEPTDVETKEEARERFQVYGDIKRKLVALGIPEEQIKFIHDAKTDEQRVQLFQEVRDGKVRILLGSTEKMGAGMNVQTRLIALHHLDAPWRPADIEQREGRILRQGNQNKEVQIYRYVTAKSFDARMWQILSRKASFIAAAMRGDLSLRETEDVGAVEMTYADAMAAASDNPLVQEKVGVDIEVRKLQALRTAHENAQFRMRREVANLPSVIKGTKDVGLAHIDAAIALRDAHPDKTFTVFAPQGVANNLKEGQYADREEAGKALNAALAAFKGHDALRGQKIGEYRGFAIDVQPYGDPRIMPDFYLRGGGQTLGGSSNEHAAVGTVASIEMVLRSLETRKATIEAEIARMEKQLADFEKQVGKPYEHTERLKELLEKQEDLNSRLDMDTGEQPQPVALMDEAGPEPDDEDTEPESPAPLRGHPARGSLTQKSYYRGQRAIVQGRISLPRLNESGAKLDAPRVGRGEIVKALEERINRSMGIRHRLPIRVGNMRVPGALGIYKMVAQVVRSKQSQDIPVIAHEIGHHLNNLLWGHNKRDLKLGPLKPFAGELDAIASKALAGQSQTPEGFAEFIRHWLTQPKVAKHHAPNFYAFWENDILDKHPELGRVLRDVQGMILRWVTQGSEKRIGASISMQAPEDTRSPLEKVRANLELVYTHAVNSLNPIEQAVNELKSMPGGQVVPGKDANIIARLLAGWTGIAESFLHHGTVDPLANAITGKSLDDVLAPAVKFLEPDEGGSEGKLRRYLVARRVVEKGGKWGLVTGVSVADAMKLVRDYDAAYPELGKVARELYRYQDQVLQYALKRGMISRKDYLKIKFANHDYVPFHRVLDLSGAKTLFGSRSGNPAANKQMADVGNPIKRMKGSQWDIIDPLESIISNTYSIISAAERNHVAQVLVQHAGKTEGAGYLVEQRPGPLDVTTAKIKELADQLEREGVNLSQVNLDAMVKIFRPGRRANAGEHEVTVLINGKRKFYQLAPELYNAMGRLSDEQLNLAFKFMAVPARILRFGATSMSTEFPIRNPFRDAWDAMLQSNNGFIPGWDSIRGLLHVLKKDEMYWEWARSGGKHSVFVSLSRDNMQESLKQLLASRTVAGRAKHYALHPWQIWPAFGELTEEMTRLGEYARARDPKITDMRDFTATLKSGKVLEALGKGARQIAVGGQGKPPKEAAFDSREVTLDFHKLGASIRVVNQIVPFFGANINGTDKFFRWHKENPRRAALTGLLSITLPTIALWLLNHDDPEYQDEPQWVKDYFWLFPVPKTSALHEKMHFLTVPRPFLWGMMYGTLAERLMSKFYAHDSEAFKGFLANLGGVALPGFLPPLAAAAWEWTSGKSAFTGQKIEPGSTEPLSPQYRAKPSTSEFAREMAVFAHDHLGMEDVSPAKIDQAIFSTTGSLGRNALNLIDLPLKAMHPEIPQRHERTFADTPFIRAFASRAPQTNSEPMERLYGVRGKLQQKLHDWQNSARQGPTGLTRGKAVMTDAEMQQLGTLNGAAAALTALSRSIENIENDPALTPAQKTIRINPIVEQRNEIARNAMMSIGLGVGHPARQLHQ